MKKQLHAGYILSSVNNVISKLVSSIDFSCLISQLSCFEVEFNSGVNSIDDSIVTVLDNLISRGLPTFPSTFIEDNFSEIFDVTKKELNNKTGDILYKENSLLTENNILIYNSFFIVDPRINQNVKSSLIFDTWENHSAIEYEEVFFNSILPNKFNESLRQLLETQRTINSILNYSVGNVNSINTQLGSLRNDFFNQRVDFSFEFPLALNNVRGLVIEIDGSQHNFQPQILLDVKRDFVLKEVGWAPTVRITTNELNSIPNSKIKQINNFLNHPYSQIIYDNFDHPIWGKEFGLEALQIALSPFAIARIQKTILFLISSGILKLDAEFWHLVFIERDVPCASLAVQDLNQLFQNLFSLEGKGRILPKIELKIFNTLEFEKCKLNDGNETKTIDKVYLDSDYDAIIDISILQRSGFSYPETAQFYDKSNYIRIRSCHSIKEHRLIKSAQPIKYLVPEEDQPKSLVYFLSNIFRKFEFREGQVNILRKTLTLQNVIALLPTGAGKSLTYQLSVLLQPGIALIIDPLKSLMRDQNDNLKTVGIDSTKFINSSIKSPSVRADLSEKMVKGYYQFVFISPERLQIAEFRNYLEHMSDTFFTYCIVDEAHCVSEWGHDFRTAYLRLGINARNYIKTLADKIPIIGLTGTASFDVLSDIQRELDIGDESSIVVPSKYEREELIFKIINSGDANIPANANQFQIKKLVADNKQTALSNLLNDIPNNNWGNDKTFDSIDSFFSRGSDYNNSGIIFCPHAGGKSVFGVDCVSSELSKHHANIVFGIYAGKLNDNDLNDLEKVQTDFKNDTLSLLIATKAFGLGIDKPNIRFTIHFSMPQSIESFYQEAGRAGRDKSLAYCYILYSPTKIDGLVSVDKSLMLSFHHNSFRGENKDKRIMLELLDEITFPQLTTNLKLNEIINNIDQNISINLWLRDNHNRLYVKGAYNFQDYGYIDLNNLTVWPNQTHIMTNPQNASQILKQIIGKLQEICPQNDSLLKWLTRVGTVNPHPGFERILLGMNPGEHKKVVVGFTNDRIQIITNYLSSINSNWNETIIEKATNYCFKSDDFIKKLRSEYLKATQQYFDFNLIQIKQLSEWFDQIRDEQDTFKAIYRLSVIGVIDEYEVDYNSKNIIATITKKSDDSYRDNLSNYIGRYVSAEEKNGVPQKILEAQGNTVIKKCCGYLAYFVYLKISKKRKEAIDEMESSIQAGLNNGDFKNSVNTYFDSKYIPDLYGYRFEFSIDNVWNYIVETKGDPDSVNHLRGACDRLLVDYPDNAAFLLLRAFSRFLIPSYNKSDALSDYREGLRKFKNENGWTHKEYLNNLSKFYKKTIQYDTSIKKYLDKEIFNEHNNWLKSFNQTFLKDLENARVK